MREIKFRAWDGDIKQMLPPQDLSQSREHWKWLGVNDVNLMQYTGLKDKNGKEIYEGDIVKMFIFDSSPVPKEIKTAVSFFEGSFIVMIINNEPVSLRDAIKTSNETKQGLEVIGNIYENSEILST